MLTLKHNTQFEWLTQSSLIFSSISTSELDSMTLTDPDQVPTPTSFSSTGTPTAAPSVVSLPSGYPARIVPGSGGVDPADVDLSGFSLIAILFDQGLNWATVVQNTDSPGQIFAWLPPLIQSALSITSDQVKSFALQVYIPNSYQGPSDVSQLGTTWLGYIPTPLVDALAAQIKVKSSGFYMDLSSPYSDLAAHVNPAYDITTVTTTTGIPGSGGSGGSSGGASNHSRTRENAIIGVVSALGGITLMVLGYLIYRAVQKRRELAHRRLSDPPTDYFVGEAPPNRNFDQDSIGGQRRRSFYFAEDSLRGFSDYNYNNDGARLSPEQTPGLNRRPIAGNIGPPVMRENSLNF
ncbi:hypothetical protein BJ322DRAFT_1101964 [Thelephora terrestris]|uniref:Uncharacterized protein n=1 Tax=Thelephora terrestris TaxID=56493 RepID=A0A9P6L1J9_9AGAM|nr:hypothetical protein BJ322DRAFT_1101964 [Thelephora terrestris]